MFYPYVIGLHGCTASVAEAVLNGDISHLTPSNHHSEWLGKGVYFWENDYHRALKWAQENIEAGEKPDVIGALINPGVCLDLSSAYALEIVKKAAVAFDLIYKKSGIKAPKNKELFRPYDCALINFVRDEWIKSTHHKEVNTVRGAFSEGERISSSTFRTLNHIQWAVVTPEKSILGYFRPTEAMQESGLLTP